MKKLYKILSVVILLLTLSPVILALADPLPPNSSSTVPGDPGKLGPPASAGFHGVAAYRIGLSQCINEEVNWSPGDVNAKATAIQEYASKYYMPVMGESVYVGFNGAIGSSTTDYFGNSIIPATQGSALYDVLSAVALDRGSNHRVQEVGGVYSVIPDEQNITEIMNELKALGPKNASLYNNWVNETKSDTASKHPVVICIEIVGETVGDGPYYWISSAQLAERICGGAYNTMISTNLTPYYNGAISTTANALVNICGITEGITHFDRYPYILTKRMFSIRVEDSNYNVLRNSTVYSHWASSAWQTLSNGGSTYGINGCTVVTIGTADVTAGTYTWHINASRLPANDEGYREDNTADAVGEKNIGIGAVDLKQSNPLVWKEWIANHGTTYDIIIDKYYRAGNTFSVEYEDVYGSRSAGGNTLSSPVSTKTIPVSAGTLWKYFTEGCELDINGMTDGNVDILGGTPIGTDRYQVAYATGVTIRASDGTEVQLANEDVHWAIYGSDNDRTYKYNQILSKGRSQVKQGDTGLNSEEFEAMSGTPTTKDLFITQGGEQFIVKTQFRYVDESYARTYTLKEEDKYPNFMYYYTSGDASGSAPYDKNNDEGWTSSYPHTWIPESEKTAKNISCYEEAYNELLSAAKSLDASIDHNYGAATDYTKYDILYPEKYEEAVSDFVKYIENDIPSSGTSASYSRTFTLAKAQDLDSSKQGSVTLTVKFSGDMSANNHNQYSKHVHDGCPYDSVLKQYTCGDPPNRFKYIDNYAINYDWSITVNYGPFSPDIKDLTYTNTLTQTFENVRYIDIVEANLFRLEGGKHVGMGNLLASPQTDLLEMACEKMGYYLYDSEQTSERSWSETEKQWMAVNISDLEKTGRVLNSYWEETVPIVLPDGSTVKWNEDPDAIEVTYDISQGGRSHYALNAYMARIAGHMFYKDNTGNDPYRNTMYMSSDVLSVNVGNAATNGYQWFAGNDVSTERVQDEVSLEQWLMSKGSNNWTKFRNKTFRKNDHSAETTGLAYQSFQDFAYLDGTVGLNGLDSTAVYAGMYNKQFICEDNPYTFVNSIPEHEGITWVGYRGDYLTTSASHEPVLKCYLAVSPMDYSQAISQREFHMKVFPADLIKLDETLAAQGSEFPHMEGLNVNRSQENNLYPTGKASILYSHDLTVDHTDKSGVLPLAPSYHNANVSLQDTRLAHNPKGCAIRATYDDSWVTPNDIVIFNPSTTENAYFIPLSEYMPDVDEVGGENPEYPLRDQRASGYVVTTSSDEVVYSGTGEFEDNSTNPTYTTVKQLRDISDMSTRAYSLDVDYTKVEALGVMSDYLTTDDSFIAPIDASYQFTVFDENSMGTSVKVPLKAGDTIKSVNGTLFKQRDNTVVTFSDFINTYNETLPDDNPYKTSPTRVDTIKFNKLNNIEAGDVIHLRLETMDNYHKSNPPFDVSVLLDDSSAVSEKLISTADGHVWDYYIEFKKDCNVNAIQINWKVSTKLIDLPNTEYVIEFVDSFVMSKGATYSDPALASSTIDFVYLDNYACAYNSNMVDYVTVERNPQDIVPNRIYVDYCEREASYVIKQSASNNPHVVYNANWKYYVTGWKTSVGNTITSPNDPLLNMDSTVLMWPSGKGSITVEDLKDTACLVKFNGSVYLTTEEAGLDYVIMEKGWRVSKFDTFTMSDTSTPLEESRIGDGTVNYPLNSGLSGVIFQNYNYEFFFKLKSGAGSNIPLYDVKYSKNASHKFAQDDINTYLNKELWVYDWKEIRVIQQSNALGVVAKDVDREATYLSLDDHFAIHFDNVGDFHETDHHNAGNTIVDLGYGFVDNMDTITWIKDKYVKFGFDVYVFGYNSTYGCADPSVSYAEYMSGTVESSKHVGNVEANLQFFSAGTPIPLGHYTDTTEDDNSCKFTDFGQSTGYTYHFWVALSSDETNQGECKFVSSNINDDTNKESGIKTNNKDEKSGVYTREANAMRKDPISIVGRVGNLTMVDTGDYRFSDTFKTTKSDADWLVYGLIKRLEAYSNTYNVPSTQKALLMDPWDVRGRLGLTSLHSFGSNYQGYKVDGNYNTYNTQWYKDLTSDLSDEGVSRIEVLPLSSAFNEHEALRMTQMRIGYSALLTLDSIGNYYGESLLTAFVEDSESEPVNPNGDYNNTKIQVRPYYIAIDTTGDTVCSYPVDVYMKTENSYVKINSGSPFNNHVDTMLNNPYNVYIETNTYEDTGTTYNLDKNMLRRMVTSDEAVITHDVIMDWNNGSSTGKCVSMLTDMRILNNDDFDESSISSYVYGNGQYLFLRDRNRTFVGSNGIALKYSEPDYVTATTDYKQHAQKWYFDVGLPSSAVFVPTGEEFDIHNVISQEGVYILQCVDIYAIGSVWTLHYQSPVSKASINVAGTPISYDVWNPNAGSDKLNWLVPVCIYDSSEATAKDDLATEGSH